MSPSHNSSRATRGFLLGPCRVPGVGAACCRIQVKTPDADRIDVTMLLVERKRAGYRRFALANGKISARLQESERNLHLSAMGHFDRRPCAKRRSPGSAIHRGS